MNAHVPLSPSMESLLAEYASGHLGHGMSVLMASFLTLSPSARRQVETFETLNGVMLDDVDAVDAVDMSNNALDAMLMRLDDSEACETQPCNISGNNDLPTPLLSLIHI